MHTPIQSEEYPIRLEIPSASALRERLTAHALAYLVFSIGAITAWMRADTSRDPMEAVRLLAILWFPAIIVELFRGFRIPNYGTAAAVLCLICGYDAVCRLLNLHGYSGC